MGPMRTACSLCGSGYQPDGRSYDVHDVEEPRHVCVPCCLRVATFVVESDARALSQLWILPHEALDAGADAGGAGELDLDVGDAVYRDMGLLEDTLFEAATAYAEINDPEVQQEALLLLFGLLREEALPRLRALLYPI